MDFNKSLFLIVSLSSLLLSGYAIPETQILFLGKSFDAEAPEPAASEAPAPGPASKTKTLLPNTLFTESAIVASHFPPHILEFCSGTENPTLCAETIAPFLQGAFDPIKALETEIEATLNQTKKVAAIITHLLNNPSTDKKALDALDICRTQYEDIWDTIKEAMELLNQQNVVDAYYKFNGVLADRSSCEDAFLESPGVDIPFAQDSLALSQLGGNCMAIMDALVNHHTMF